MRESSLWTRASRKKEGGKVSGGIHLYLPADILERGLAERGIDPKENDLEVCITGMTRKFGRVADFRIRVRKRKVKLDGSNNGSTAGQEGQAQP